MTQYDEEVVNEKVVDCEALAIITSVRDGHGNGLITIDNRQINFLLGPVMVFVMMLSML